MNQTKPKLNITRVESNGHGRRTPHCCTDEFFHW